MGSVADWAAAATDDTKRALFQIQTIALSTFKDYYLRKSEYNQWFWKKVHKERLEQGHEAIRQARSRHSAEERHEEEGQESRQSREGAREDHAGGVGHRGQGGEGLAEEEEEESEEEEERATARGRGRRRRANSPPPPAHIQRECDELGRLRGDESGAWVQAPMWIGWCHGPQVTEDRVREYITHVPLHVYHRVTKAVAALSFWQTIECVLRGESMVKTTVRQIVDVKVFGW